MFHSPLHIQIAPTYLDFWIFLPAQDLFCLNLVWLHTPCYRVRSEWSAGVLTLLYLPNFYLL